MQNRILIVEDEEMIARALQIELEHEGYQVLVEHEGKSGHEAGMIKCERHHIDGCGDDSDQ